MQVQADTPRVNEAIERAGADATATSLFITSVRLGIAHLTVQDVRCILHFLEDEDNIRFNALDIPGFHFHRDALIEFCNRLPSSCPHVTEVYLRCNNLGNEQLEILLPAFTRLTLLYLKSNNIEGERGGEVIEAVLVDNNTLEELNLSFNPQFGPNGARGVGQGLARNNVLQDLDLSRCNIGNEGIRNLVNAVSETTTTSALTHVRLQSNNIEGTVGMQLVVSLARRLENLQVLALAGNDFSQEQQRELQEQVDDVVAGHALLRDARAMNTGTAPPPRHALFQALVEASQHAEGLSASVVILQNHYETIAENLGVALPPVEQQQPAEEANLPVQAEQEADEHAIEQPVEQETAEQPLSVEQRLSRLEGGMVQLNQKMDTIINLLQNHRDN